MSNTSLSNKNTKTTPLRTFTHGGEGGKAAPEARKKRSALPPESADMYRELTRRYGADFADWVRDYVILV